MIKGNKRLKRLQHNKSINERRARCRHLSCGFRVFTKTRIHASDHKSAEINI